ncbi:MAG: methylenetetrahydrofolate reductase C-terminal domain-containing protein [Chloroflexi bacterium]|nr:methylenetetrahydrofolate reductase C-terminal domain-containing protein [Chloroflexota bacterium]
MIVAKQKSLDKLVDMIQRHKRVLLVGCATCVAECAAGGEREVSELGPALRMALRLRGRDTEVLEKTIERQCELEFVDNISDTVEECDAVLSAGCGIGAQIVAERFQPVPVYPALDTTFLGVREQPGVWSERCAACGECVLDRTGGICPIIRCSKGLLNGPCGGSHDGKCEISDDVECGWALIVERLRAMDRLDELDEYQPPKDWSTSRDGGPRRIVREDLRQ